MLSPSRKVKREKVSSDQWLFNDLLEHEVNRVASRIRELLSQKNEILATLKIDNATYQTMNVNKDYEIKELKQKLEKHAKRNQVLIQLLKKERLKNYYLYERLQSFEENLMDERIVKEVEEELSAEKIKHLVEVDEVNDVELIEESHPNSHNEIVDLDSTKEHEIEEKEIESEETDEGFIKAMEDLVKNSNSLDSDDEVSEIEEELEDIESEESGERLETGMEDLDNIETNMNIDDEEASQADMNTSLPTKLIGSQTPLKENVDTASLEELLSEETSTETDLSLGITTEEKSDAGHCQKTVDVPQVRHKITTKRKRRLACNECSACSREDCGSCSNCKDKPKFGGPGTKKQKCLMRKCQNVSL